MTAQPQPVPTGVCPVCRRARQLTDRGVLRNHAASTLRGERWCKGTGMEPVR